MNKFFAFAIVALVCASASAEQIDDGYSEFAIPSKTEELNSVPQHLKTAFEDFCSSSRDWVLSGVQQQTNDVTSNLFKIFFSSVEALGQEAVDTQKLAAEKLSRQLANPSAPVERSEGAVNEIIANGQAKINQAQNTPAAFFNALKSAFSATSSAVGSYAGQKLDNLKKLASIETVGSGIKEVCERIKSYENEVRGQFEEYKAENLQNKEEYSGLTLDDVKCATARRVSQIEGACRFGNSLVPFAQKLWGYPKSVY